MLVRNGCTIASLKSVPTNREPSVRTKCPHGRKHAAKRHSEIGWNIAILLVGQCAECMLTLDISR